MKLFLKRFLIFILPVLVLLYPLDVFLSNQLQKTFYHVQDEYSVWNAVYSGKIKTDIAIFGSSRAWVHIDPAIIKRITGSSAYNLGLDGYNYWIQNFRNNIYLEKNHQPKQIIYSLDMFTFEKKSELYNADQFLPYMLMNGEMKLYLDKYNYFNTLDFYVPLIRFYGKRKALKYVIRNSTSPEYPDSGRVDGYMGMKNEWNASLDSLIKTMGHIEVEIDTSLIVLFDSFLAQCKQKNIQVVLVYTPEYIEGQSFVSNRKEIISIYQNLALKYNIPFLDYSTHEIGKDKNNFYNASHLKLAGAEFFSSILANDLNNLN